MKCAETLRRGLRADEAEIVLFDRQNHLVFSPLLAEVVGSSINALDVVVPLRQLLPGVFAAPKRCATWISRPAKLNIKERTANPLGWRMITW